MNEEDYAGMTPEDYAAMAGITLDGTPLPSPAIGPEAQAYAAMTPEEQEAMADYYSPRPPTTTTAFNMTAARIAINSPMDNDQLFDLVAKQSPELADLAQTIKNDPEFAQSFRNALQKDPSMLEGLSTLGQDGSNLNIDDLNTKLQDPENRRIFGDVLDKIAESPDDNFNFATLTTLAGHIEKGENVKAASLLQTMGIPLPAGADGMGLAIQFFTDLMQNPEMAVLNLVNSLEGAGMIDEQMGNQIMSFAPELAGFAKFMVEPSHNLMVENNITMDSIKNIPNAMAESGAERRAALEGRDTSFQASADTGNVIDFGEKFRVAAEGEDLTDINVVLNNLIEADPELADEVALIKTDANLMEQFKTWSSMMTSEEVAAASAEKLYDNINSAPNLKSGITAGLAPAA